MKSLEPKDCLSLLNDNYVGHLAFIDDGQPFVIPISYYFDQKESILAYSGDGHKIHAMRKNPKVSLQVEEVKGVKNWKSVLVHGTFEELFGAEAKSLLNEFAEGVKRVVNKIEQTNPRFINEVTSDVYSTGSTVVYRIKISRLTGKQMDK